MENPLTTGNRDEAGLLVVTAVMDSYPDPRSQGYILQEKLKPIIPRSLTNRELGWIRDITNVNQVWRGIDVSRTRVIAEGLVDEGMAFALNPDQPENRNAESTGEMVGNLWIQLNDGSTINVQLSQTGGRLKELYVLFIGPKNVSRKISDDWIEISRTAVDG